MASHFLKVDLSGAKAVTTLLTLCLLFPSNSQATHSCTAFSISNTDEIVVGKNYDWQFGSGTLIVNKRGVSKTAAQDSENFGEPASWVSKFGSVTLNQYGREFPEGGMNEAGLVVQGLSLLETEYPEPDQRPAISSSQWIQYQLDNFNTVEDVITSTARVRISPSPHYPGAHYFVCDRFANCASIEFIRGKLVSHSQQTMPVKALTASKEISQYPDTMLCAN